MNHLDEIRPRRPSPLHSRSIERIVAVHDGGMCIRTAGVGKPTVVLDSAIGKGRDAWNRIFFQIARATRVFAYDRKGIGGSTSPASGEPHTNRDMADDLFELLQSAHIDGPFVLVGHSIGGINVRLFARAHPELVAGVVLVEAADDPTPLWNLMPAEARARRREELRTGPEGLDWDAFVQGANDANAANISLGKKPLVVVTRGQPDAPPGASPDIAASWFDIWKMQQAMLLKLSTNAVHIVARDSGHRITDQAPEVIEAAIIAAVHAWRTSEKGA